MGALEAATPRLLTPKQEAVVAKLEAVADKLDAAGQSDKAEQVRGAVDDVGGQVQRAWRVKRDRYMDVLCQKAITHYATAVVIAKRYDVKTDWTQEAVSRLRSLAEKLGDEKMKAYVEQTPDPFGSGTKLVYGPELLR